MYYTYTKQIKITLNLPILLQEKQRKLILFKISNVKQLTYIKDSVEKKKFIHDDF